VWSALAQADAELDARPRADELNERHHDLDIRICGAEMAIGRVALDRLGLDLSPSALRTRGLQPAAERRSVCELLDDASP
jgi:hypothetical protein